jgi:hypothetical protein
MQRMNSRLLLSWTAAIGFFLLTATHVAAELPLIRLDRIFPLGGQAGTEVQLEIGGKDLDDVKTLHFDHKGFKASFLKANQFKVAIADDVPPGTYEVRAVGRFGISAVQLFQVSRGLTEVLDKEPNDSPEQAQTVTVNSAINGRSDSNGDDFFRFAAKKGQRIVVDCLGFRLNSTLRAILTLSTVDGKELLQSKPYYHRTDPLLDFVAPADGDYVLRLHDMTFLGGLPYRLILSDRPHIENVFPSAVVPGEKTELTLLGRNLPRGKTVPAWNLQGQAFEELTLPITTPKDRGLLQRFTFINHFPSANLNARGLQIWPESLKTALNPTTLFLADAPVTVEREPNDSAETAQAISLPTVISGRFDKPGDADWYTFTAKAGETWAVDLLCERLDFPGDPFVIVFDAKGNEVATFDDHGINFNALAQANRDPLGTFRIPADGMYRLFVQERYRHGGPRYQYVLRLTKATADFYPVVCHETPSDPSCPTVRQGGTAFYELCLNRRNHNGPVTIEAEGLPPGVSCPPVHVSAQSQFANVVFSAAADAPEWSGAIRLKAWAVVDGEKIEREVRCAQRRWPIANVNASLAVRQICLAVRDKAPYGLKVPSGKLEVAAGASVDFALTVDRHWPDFKGAVKATGLNLPPGFSFAAVTVAADKTNVTGTLKVAGNVPAGAYSIVLRADAQVPYTRDAKSASAPNVRVADPSTPLTVWVNALPKK